MAEISAVLTTPEVPTLLTTSMIGRLPTAMATLGVLLLIRGQGGDYTLAGGLAAMFTAGTATGQPTLARIVDRRGQWHVLLAAVAISTTTFIVLALSGAHHPVISAVACAIAGLGTPPLEPCLRSLWPHVISDSQVLRAAFSLDVGVQELVFVAGLLSTVTGGTLVGHAGGVFGCTVPGMLDTVGFAVSRTSRGWRPAPSLPGAHASPMHKRMLVRVVLPALACRVPVAALAIAAAAFADRHGSSSITGWALAANADGALAAGLYGAVRPGNRQSERALTVAGLALAVSYLPLAIPLPVGVWLRPARSPEWRYPWC